MARLITFDASVLIAHLDATDAHHDRATALLSSMLGESWGASLLTLAEVLVGPARAGTLEVATAALQQLEIAGVDLDEDAPVKLATLRAATGLKLPDCCVLLAAGKTGGAVATFDGRLAQAARARGLEVRPA